MSGHTAVRPVTAGEVDGLRPAVERWAATRPAHGVSAGDQAAAALDAFRATASGAAGEVLLAGDAETGALGGWMPLAWDSEVLGVPAGRCISPAWWGTGDADAALSAVAAQAARRADAAGIDLLFLRCDARDATLPRLLAGEGFWLADTLVTFALPLDGTAVDGEIEHARAEDVPALRTIARAFRTGHFHADPRIGRERADALYVRWVENSLAGRADAFLVVRGAEGVPLGFITCRLIAGPAGSAPQGVIELVAVDPRAQGQRVGHRLVAASLRWFARAGAASVEVGTQVDNLAAVHLYQRAGFRAAAFSHTFHRWAPR
ncbi:GNAT family N-acetyltransferase [Longimicrobium sp.]|uniref:GNAT family N-acetyltransferase n=1 Tax=Longimicrobium sp. TaxID=2029185 RepID=UPI003B3A3AE2